MGVCVGCGLYINPDTGLLEVERAPGGGLTCTDAGLAVSFPASQTGSTTWDSTTGQVIRSSDACQGLETRGNGLWAPRVCTLANTALRGYQGATFPVGLTVGGTYVVENDGGVVSITNNTDCTLMGKWDVQASGGRIVANPGFDATMYLGTKIDGGGWGAAIPVTRIRMDNRASAAGDPNGGVVEYNAANFHEENWSPLAPAQTISFMANVNLIVTAGIAGVNAAGTWHDTPDFPRFEFHWHWTPEGNC